MTGRAFANIVLRLAVALVFLFAQCGSAAAFTRAKAAILVNLTTGKTLFELNADKKLPPASLTKIMTMFLTLDAVSAGRLKLKDKVTINAEIAKTPGSAMRLSPGDKVPVVRLLAGTAVASGNDAATALAGKTGGSVKNFVRKMNHKAAALGMSRTQFKNPTGLPAADHKTTARDLAALCRAYLKAHPEGKRFHSMTNFAHKGMAIHNTNPLLGRQGIYGLKTGWTIASGYNLILTAKKGKINLLAVVLGAPNKEERNTLALRLIEAGYRFPNSPGQAKKFIASKK